MFDSFQCLVQWGEPLVHRGDTKGQWCNDVIFYMYDMLYVQKDR